MTALQRLAAGCLAVILTVALFAGPLAGRSYEKQFREHPNEPPSWTFPLGTDELGRDRLARLLYGTRVSLLLAPAAAALATLLAAILGVSAGYFGGWWERAAMTVADLFVALPWIFALITVRAVLPLNISPWTSVTVTFLLLGALGWASSARVIRAGARAAKSAPFVLQARAFGSSPLRLLSCQILPNLRPAIAAQFWISIPLFLLAEANLGMLGLGVTEPLPSWGNLLAELTNPRLVVEQPWLLAPAGLLATVLASFHLILSTEDLTR
ncbi:MAG: ABC transporter permease [Bryobacteraceae bacterium]